MSATIPVWAVRVTLALAPLLVRCAPARNDPPAVVIVTTSAVDAFDDATEGLRRALSPTVKIAVVDLALKPTDLATQLGGKDVRLLISVGNNALEAAARFGTAPILATMVLEADLKSSQMRQPAGAVVLDLSLGDVLAGLVKVFPGKKRVGMIRNPETSPRYASLLMLEARTAGIYLKVVDCPSPEKLLEALRSLEGQVDFVWCPPDGTLYNGTTVKPLIVASLENRLPIAGFSASFVRAGAAAGVYPDYLDAGLEAGEMARRYLAADGALGIELPRKVRVAANASVARLLGLRFNQKTGGESGIVVLE